jgi:hypothetical protein
MIPAVCATGFSQASRLLKKSASGVLATLRGSTYRTEYDSAPSLAAALPGGLVEQPANNSEIVCDLLGFCFPAGLK